MSAPLLRVSGLRRIHGRTGFFSRAKLFAALDDASLEVAAGTIHGLVGESGSGKSTLARIVAGLERPQDGRVELGGEDRLSMTPARAKTARRDVQMVFQDPYGSLNPRRRIGWSIAEPLVSQPALAAREREVRVADALVSVGLSPPDADRFPHQFSGGQRQRIAIARALIARPKLLVADEATSALDLSVQAQILNLLMDLNERDGLTILFISHDLGVVAALCDRISVMRQGRIIEEGPTQAVLTRPRDAYTQALVAADPALRARFA